MRPQAGCGGPQRGCRENCQIPPPSLLLLPLPPQLLDSTTTAAAAAAAAASRNAHLLRRQRLPVLVVSNQPEARHLRQGQPGAANRLTSGIIDQTSLPAELYTAAPPWTPHPAPTW